MLCIRSKGSVRFKFYFAFSRFMNLLFICNQNKHRSKTAEELFRGRFHTKSAGLYNGTPITVELLSWADVLVVMDDAQRKELVHRFPKQVLQKRLVTLDVPDTYYYQQPELVELLQKKADLLV